ncbi:MAG: hypothetical protein K9J30_00660 [Bacteroidales bacterium]|nr:hypothetical protein [Bacteroidales bacterium]
MLHDLKYALLFFTLTACSVLMQAQVPDSIDYEQKLDSLHGVISQKIEEEIKLVKYRFDRKLYEKDKVIDSMYHEINILEDQLRNHAKELGKLQKLNMKTTEQLSQTRTHLEKEKYRFRRILYISLPSILFLLLVSTVLFFVFLTRYQSKTDRRIISLEQSIYSQIDAGMEEMKNTIKRRMRKIRLKLRKEIKSNKKAGK